ncbi:VOC family protein [Nocardia niwae]|uniref:VOC family protein n=1 Tax=Nocardia niwae TaxID=626084 RepID=A0ABV2X6Y3_9NOCA
MNVFQRLHHVCIVVPDMSAAVAYYESIGIGPWHEYPPLTEYIDLKVPDRDAFLNLDYRYSDAVGIQIQLVQPGVAESPQREFLRRTGGGVFHLGFSVENVAESTEQAVRAGMNSWMTGRRADGSGFTYFDSAADAGVTLEIRESKRK